MAPARSVHGDVLRAVGDGHALAVYPFLDGTAGSFDDVVRGPRAAAVVALLGALHAVDPAGTPARVDDLVVPMRAELVAAIDDLDHPWDAGPHGEAARRALAERTAGVVQLIATCDHLRRVVLARPDRFVLTHGEPHPGNVMRTDAGLVLIDWDTALVAPPERDLWTVAGHDRTVLAAYTQATGRAVQTEVLACYERMWDLTEIALYVALLRDTHDDTADVRASLRNLQGYLAATTSVDDEDRDLR